MKAHPDLFLAASESIAVIAGYSPDVAEACGSVARTASEIARYYANLAEELATKGPNLQRLIADLDFVEANSLQPGLEDLIALLEEGK